MKYVTFEDLPDNSIVFMRQSAIDPPNVALKLHGQLIPLYNSPGHSGWGGHKFVPQEAVGFSYMDYTISLEELAEKIAERVAAGFK